ncbi:MAG TPA: hypothetical protein VGF51_07670 [Acidimicrobiales bacterium]|jgi:hypothetical protein
MSNRQFRHQRRDPLVTALAGFQGEAFDQDTPLADAAARLVPVLDRVFTHGWHEYESAVDDDGTETVVVTAYRRQCGHPAFALHVRRELGQPPMVRMARPVDDHDDEDR